VQHVPVVHLHVRDLEVSDAVDDDVARVVLLSTSLRVEARAVEEDAEGRVFGDIRGSVDEFLVVEDGLDGRVNISEICQKWSAILMLDSRQRSNLLNFAESSVFGTSGFFSSTARSCTSNLTRFAAPFFIVLLLASFECACAASNSSSLTVSPSSSAIRRVRSTGKPKVSYRRHTSLPPSSVTPAAFALPANWSKSFSPRSSVRENDSSSSSRISLISSTFLVISGNGAPMVSTTTGTREEKKEPMFTPSFLRA
jgi:hypothetical protein